MWSGFINKKPKVRPDGQQIQYAWEFSVLHKLRTYSDGITFLEFDCSYDRYDGDHKPSFSLMLVFLNYKIFEFNIYNVFHSIEEDDWGGEE